MPKPLPAITENFVFREAHAKYRNELRKRFPELNGCSHNLFLMLRKYIHDTPHQFYCKSTYANFLQWLQERDQISPAKLKQYFLTRSTILNRAFLHLEEINKLEWHDHFEGLDDYEEIRFIDQKIHPAYLRLVEGVFSPFAHMVCHFSRLDRQKGTEGLNLWSIVEELAKTDLHGIANAYKHVVRNGIAHGHITYMQKEIRYEDSNGNSESYKNYRIIQTFDELLDACNAIALALTVFLIVKQPQGYYLPQQIMLEELREETLTPWWQVINCTTSESNGQNQLLLFARPSTKDSQKVQYFAFQSGILAEAFAPGYDRYFFSIRSNSSWPGWAAFDGKRLCELRNKENAMPEDYKNVLESYFFHEPGFKLLRLPSKLETYAFLAKKAWREFIEELKRQRNIPEIHVREAKIHRTSWGCVLNGSIYIDLRSDDDNQDIIRRNLKKITRIALTQARRETPLFQVVRYLPLGFSQISVYSKNYRRRRLENYGLARDLVCTIQIKRIKRIQCPDIIGASIEQLNGYRIAWNRAWLEEVE